MPSPARLSLPVRLMDSNGRKPAPVGTGVVSALCTLPVVVLVKNKVLTGDDIYRAELYF